MQNWPFTLDRSFPLPTAGTMEFVEGCALHTSHVDDRLWVSMFVCWGKFVEVAVFNTSHKRVEFV